MGFSDNLLARLKDAQGGLSKAERKIAEFVLDDPEASIRVSITQLALSVGVSEPTINRFSRSMGCTGFPDFKLRLAQSIATSDLPPVRRRVHEFDGNDVVIDKTFDTVGTSLAFLKESIDKEMFARCVDAMAQARKIEFYGVGSSAPTAIDCHHKFFRLGVDCVAYTDVLMQRMSAALLTSTSVAVIFSNSGRSVPLARAAEVARRSGATVIGVTAGGSPMTEWCDLVLEIPANDTGDFYAPLTSRFGHLVLIDALAIGVMLRRGPGIKSQLQSASEALDDARLPIRD